MARVVRDLMVSRVVSVRADETVATTVDRMTRYGFSALPVVTPTFRLVGVVSLLDVIRYREEHAEEGLTADEQVAVAEIMNPDVVSMAATAKVAAVARRLAENGHLRVLPVVQGGRLVGILTRSDLLRGLAGPAPDPGPGGGPTSGQGGGRPGGLRRLLGRGDREEDDVLHTLARQRRTGPPPPAATPVRQVMTADVRSVRPDDPVAAAAEVMLRHRHSSLPVVAAGGRLVGIISEADILADPQAGRRVHATVGSVMTRTVITLGAGATVGEARSLVAEKGVRILPVVDGDVLVGVLSRSDLL